MYRASYLIDVHLSIGYINKDCKKYYQWENPCTKESEREIEREREREMGNKDCETIS